MFRPFGFPSGKNQKIQKRHKNRPLENEDGEKSDDPRRDNMTPGILPISLVEEIDKQDKTELEGSIEPAKPGELDVP
jgi:hypothetical protein